MFSQYIENIELVKKKQINHIEENQMPKTQGEQKRLEERRQKEENDRLLQEEALAEAQGKLDEDIQLYQEKRRKIL